MAKEVALSLNLDGSKAETAVKSFKQQVREAENDLTKIVEKFGATSTEAAKAAQKVAQLRDAIGDAKDLANAFNPDKKFEAFSGALRGVTGGFAALQGAIGLTGTESEDLQKQLLKVQSALALSEGLNAITSAKDSFKNLASVIKSQVITSFGSLRAALISTGIGALVVGLGLLVANFDSVKKAVMNFIPGLSSLFSWFGKVFDAITDFIGVTSDATRALEKMAEAQKAVSSAIEGQIKILTAQGGKEKEIYELQKKRIEGERQVIISKAGGLEKLEDLNEKELESYLGLNNELAVLEASETARKKKKSEDEEKELEEKLKKQRQSNIDEAAAAQKLLDISEAARLKRFGDRKSGNNTAFNQDDVAKSEEDARKERDKATEDADNERVEKQLANLKKVGTAVFDKLNAEVEGNKAKNKSILESDMDHLDKKRALRDIEVQLYADGSNAIISILGQQSALSKGLALSQIGIDTALAISALTKNSEANPSNAVTFGASGIVQFATGLVRILANIAKAKQLLSSPSTPSVNVGGSIIAPPSISSLTIPPPQLIGNKTLDQAGINNQGNAAQRVYFIDRDASSAIEREKRLARAAKLG